MRSSKGPSRCVAVDVIRTWVIDGNKLLLYVFPFRKHPSSHTFLLLIRSLQVQEHLLAFGLSIFIEPLYILFYQLNIPCPGELALNTAICQSLPTACGTGALPGSYRIGLNGTLKQSDYVCG